MIHGKTILIVDDEPRTREGIRKTLEGWSAGRNEIRTAASGVEAAEWLKVQSVDLLITDVRMPEFSGLSLVEAVQDYPSKPVVLIMSGHADFQYAQQAIKLGVVDYLLKPIEKEQLIQTVEKALELGEQQRRIQTMQKLVDPKLLDARERGDQRLNPQISEAIAYVEAHLGEPVTMREIAELLHLNSSYFSVLFKEQMGINFSEYLTRNVFSEPRNCSFRPPCPSRRSPSRWGIRQINILLKCLRASKQSAQANIVIPLPPKRINNHKIVEFFQIILVLWGRCAHARI